MMETLPPGGISDILWSRNPGPIRLTGNISWSSEAVPIFFDFISTTADVILGNFSMVNSTYSPQTSPSFASAQRNDTVVEYNRFLTGYNITGETGWERFKIGQPGSLTSSGQKFLYSYNAPNSSSFTHPVMGIGFRSTLIAPNFVQYLYQQGKLNNSLIAFALNMSIPIEVSFSYGEFFLGYVDQNLLAAPLTNYSRNVDTAAWSMFLSNINVGSYGVGYNGYVTWDTTSLFNVVPEPVFYSLLSLVGADAISTVQEVENLTVASFSCSASNYSSTFPNIEYYVNDIPLTLTPFQYVLVRTVDQCLFGFAGCSTYPPVKAAFTLGIVAMNTTMTVFDMENNWVGVAPLQNFPNY